MAQIFIEKIFETHVDWMELINNDDNYKNILQVKIQKEFKIFCLLGMFFHLK